MALSLELDTMLARHNAEAGFDLEQHYRYLIDKYYEGVPASDKENLLKRILSEEGNKRYAVNKNRNKDDPQYIIDKNGSKIYELDDLKYFPSNKDMEQMEEKGILLPKESFSSTRKKRGLLWRLQRHRHNRHQHNEQFQQQQEQSKQVAAIIQKLAGNDSKISKDLAEILAHTDLDIRIRNWQRPNASVAFKKAAFGEKNNKAVLFVSDKLFNPKNRAALVGFISHEMGHVLDFNARPENARAQYMDGSESYADISGSQLAVNAGLDPRGFGKFMGDDYDNNKEMYEKEPMLYTPSGNYRRENFDVACNIMKQTRHKRLEKGSERTISDKIKEYRGLSSPAPDKPVINHPQNLNYLHYMSERNSGR